MNGLNWFQSKMGELQNNREYLREYISVLRDEVASLKGQFSNLTKALNAAQQAVQADADGLCQCGEPDCEDCGDGLPALSE